MAAWPADDLWTAATSGAFLGTFSHVLIDSLVHRDVLPLAPFSDTNPLLGVVSFGMIHLLCVGVGVLGVIGLVIAAALDAGR